MDYIKIGDKNQTNKFCYDLTFGLNCEIYSNMNGQKNNLGKICFAILVMALMAGAVSVYAPRQVKIVKTKREIAQTPNLIKMAIRDSLATNTEYLNILFNSNYEYQKLVKRNQYLFDAAVIEYRRRLEREYPAGRFFSDADLHEINAALQDYATSEIHTLLNRKPVNKHELEYWNMVANNPVTSGTGILDVTKLLCRMRSCPFAGLSVTHNRIILANEGKNKTLQKFYDAYYIDAPNFRIPEFARIYPEYNKNLRDMTKYESDVNRMHEIENNITEATQQKFIMRTDSLVKKLLELAR